MRLSLRQIEYLAVVAKQKSISGACKKLNISQSSVLAAINQAEESAGVKFFYRKKGRGIELTPAGQNFMITVRKFLAAESEFGNSLASFSSAVTPVLKLGCFSPFGSLLIPPVLKEYLNSYGDCEVILKEGSQVELRNWLASGDVDLVVTYDIGETYGSGITPICNMPAHALLHKKDPDASSKSISMKRLSKKTHILLDLPETRAYLLALFDFTGQRPKIGLRTRSYETIRTAVANGLGASVLNIRPSDTSPDTIDLVRVPISDKLRQPTLMVADPYGDRKPAYVTAFIEILYQYFFDLGPSKFAVSTEDLHASLLFPKPAFSH